MNMTSIRNVFKAISNGIDLNFVFFGCCKDQNKLNITEKRDK